MMIGMTTVAPYLRNKATPTQPRISGTNRAKNETITISHTPCANAIAKTSQYCKASSTPV